MVVFKWEPKKITKNHTHIWDLYSHTFVCVTVKKSLGIYVAYISIYDKLLVDSYVYYIYFE